MTSVGERSAARRALRVTLGYVAIAAIYIVFSSTALESLDSETQSELEVVKGIAFVAVTGLLLWLLVRRQLFSLVRAEQRLAESVARIGVAQQASSIAVLAAAAGHDLRNAVAAIRANVDFVLEDDTLSPEAREALEDIRLASERCGDATSDLMKRAQRVTRPAHEEVVDLARVIDASIALLDVFARGHQCDVVVSVSGINRVRGSERELEYTIVNLLVNAADACDRKGRIAVRLERLGSDVTLTVRDSGPGVPSELRERIFEPFFSTKGALGNGIGLAVCRSVAAQLGGELRLTDVESPGATFELRLPAATSK